MIRVTVFILLLGVICSRPLYALEQWECALNLQQGDTGSMTLQRADAELSGNISIKRNDSEFSQELEGRWVDREVELKRFVTASSNQSMHGIAIRVGASQVKMGGRYAEGLNGVWSADCDLVSGSSDSTKSAPANGDSEAAPSISARALPSRPNSSERITFSAQAFHASGIESVTFYVNGKAIHSCDNSECKTEHGPLKQGNHQWHVIAKSKSGIENDKRSNGLTVAAAAKQGNCAIKGLATGPAVSQSSNVAIKLIGGGKEKSTRFDGGAYSFDSIPSGSYQLLIDSPATLGVLVSPTTIKLKCAAQRTLVQNFDFR